MAAAALICLAAITVGAPAMAAAPAHSPVATLRGAGVPGAIGALGAPGATAAPVQRAAGSANGALATVDTEIVHGGYVAAGIGMRNLGHGTISIAGMPAGATVKSATLLWDVLADSPDASFTHGTFNGHSIRGTRWASGASPCWPAHTNWSYEADVTSLVSRNGSYSLADFASGDTDGRDPWIVGSDPPLLEGASLVVIYQKASMPQVVVQIAEGASETQSGRTVKATLGGFSVDSTKSAKTTFIVADGQAAGNTGAFDGTTLPGVSFPGADAQAVSGYSQGNLWDTVTADVSSLVKRGDTASAMALTGSARDCLVWVGQVLQVAGTGFIPVPADNWQSYTSPASPLPGWDPINLVILRAGYASDVSKITEKDLVSALNSNSAPWFTAGIGSGLVDAARGRCVSQQDAAVQSGDSTRSKQDFSWRRVKPYRGTFRCLDYHLIQKGYTTNHVRGYIQQASGAWFLAVSQEQFCKVGKDRTKWHCITPNGYDEGRLQLIDDLQQLPGYEADVTYVHEYMAGSPPFAKKDPLGHPKFDDLVAVVVIEKKPAK